MSVGVLASGILLRYSIADVQERGLQEGGLLIAQIGLFLISAIILPAFAPRYCSWPEPESTDAESRFPSETVWRVTMQRSRALHRMLAAGAMLAALGFLGASLSTPSGLMPLLHAGLIAGIAAYFWYLAGGGRRQEKRQAV